MHDTPASISDTGDFPCIDSKLSCMRLSAALRDGVFMLGAGDWQHTPRHLCESLMCVILGCRRLDLLAEPEQEINPQAMQAFREGIRRLSSGEPLQYVAGGAYFMDRLFRVDSRVLIPRPESEILVLSALGLSELWGGTDAPVILDLGTGSGCLAITLALERPAAVCLAADSSAAALMVASENARAHKLEERIVFFHANGLPDIGARSVDLVISNPPYVATSDYLGLPRYIRDHEPRAALDGGTEGLTVIAAFVVQSVRCLKPGGWFLMEIGDGQATAVRSLMREAGFRETRLVRDLAGRERVIHARL